MTRLRETTASLLASAIALIAALGVGAILIAAFTPASPIEAYAVMFDGAFGSVYGITETLAKATPLLLIALGLMIAFRCNLFIIGAEGQLYMGAMAAAWVGAFATGLPGWLHIPTAIVFAVFAGAFWGAVPGILRAKLEVNEIISSLMLNYVAMYFVGYLVSGPWRDPEGPEPQSPAIFGSAVWEPMIEQTRLHGGVLVALALAVVAYIFLWRTAAGFNFRAVGSNPDAARLAGLSVQKRLISAAAIAGGAAGLAGLIELAGVHQRLIAGISGGYGYSAIVVALLGKLHPVGIVVASVAFAALVVGADAMQQFAQVPAALALVIQGLTILFVICADKLARRIVGDK